MIKLKKISQSEVEPLVKLSFEGDEDLICKYHVCNEGFEECVTDTCNRIKDMSKIQKLEYFKVIYHKKPIGFVVTCYKRLYSFGISMAFRKKEILDSYWQSMKKVLGKEFICSLYAKNERGISYLKRNGMAVGEIDKVNRIITLINVK